MSLSLLAAGACYDGTTFSRCALQPSECGTSQLYRSSRWMSTNDSTNAAKCGDQGAIHNIPALGRCDAESERFICTSDDSACRIDASFKAADPDCTVLNDFRAVDSPFTRSYYGECVATESGESQGFDNYCAWKFNECPTGGMYVFETADEFFAGATPSCQCDQVRIGACVSSSDPTDFFCAISEEVCATETGFTYSKSFEVVQNLGTTCKLCNTLPSSPITRYAEAGACIVTATNVFKRCALVPEHCDGQGEQFISPRTLSSGISTWPAEAQICLSQEGLHQVRVGRCVADSDNNICVPHETACKLSQSFQANDDQCQLVKDLNPDGGLSTTHFGHCTADEMTTFSGFEHGRENYCAWSFDECKSDDENARPLSFGNANPGLAAAQPTCQCDDVRVGACVNEANPALTYCAVAAGACDEGYTYQSVRVLESPSASNTICFLCKTLPPGVAPSPGTQPTPKPPTRNPTPSPVPPPPTPVARPPSPAPVRSPTRPPQSPTANKPSLESELQEELEDDGLAIGAVFGIVIGVLLATAIFGTALCFMYKGNTAASQPPVVSSPPAPQHQDVEQLAEGQTEGEFALKENVQIT